MTLDPRLLAALTVLPPPSGARVKRDLVYRTDGDRVLKLDLYGPPSGGRASAVVFLVNGDAPEEVIAKAKDWGVYRSYGEHLAACRLGRGCGRPVAGRNDRAHSLAKALVGVGVDPRAIGVVGRGLAGNSHLILPKRVCPMLLLFEDIGKFKMTHGVTRVFFESIK